MGFCVLALRHRRPAALHARALRPRSFEQNAGEPPLLALCHLFFRSGRQPRKDPFSLAPGFHTPLNAGSRFDRIGQPLRGF